MPPKLRYPFVKTLGLRHKSTMDWGMRARAQNQIHWDKYWYPFEPGQVRSKGYRDGNISGRTHSLDTPQAGRDNKTKEANTKGNTTVAQKEDDEVVKVLEAAASSTTAAPEGESELGYFFFSQPLDHFLENSTSSSSPPANRSNTFRQYYHISSEFYKPGGPIILWIPGESPLHSLFLRRGLAYELANATSGLLVALEHRFYGGSIPRFQEFTAAVRKGSASRDKTKHVITSQNDEPGMEGEMAGRRLGRGRVWGADTVVPPNPRTSTDVSPKARINANAKVKEGRGGSGGDDSNGDSPNKGNSHRNNTKHSTPNGGSGKGDKKEGLPLDLLKYLSVDQSIEDIIHFMNQFPTLQPTFFSRGKSGAGSTTASSNPRWILAGCSYGGNLAAWTRQRYPSKVFAAFASSAPVRSALDFYEYSTSQSSILGQQCSQRLAHARDFLDGALMMTDEFMQHMAYLDKKMPQKFETEKTSLQKSDAIATTERQLRQSIPHIDYNTTPPPTPRRKSEEEDKKARHAAKLRVLTWFSPDFAKEYASNGEEVHAAGWIWWTVASAVQYNGAVTPPGVEPVKTAIDILCGTMAQVDISTSSDQGTVGATSLESVQYAKALATWFKDQQYYTPTKAEDLRPSDLDPNSVQNLASMAWLWQTCSELGYLQTSQPSSHSCLPCSASSPTVKSVTVDRVQSRTASFRANILLSYNSTNTPYSTASVPSLPYQTGEPASRDRHSASSQVSSRKPCHCYANNDSQPKESVFSRLLTLEAAWQECQLYFGTTHSHRNDVNKKSSVENNSSETSQANISHQSDTESLGKGEHEQGDGNLNGENSDDASTPHLLHGYPDVERNVNRKFRGWEIAQEFSPLTDSKDATAVDETFTTATATTPGRPSIHRNSFVDIATYGHADSGSGNGGRYYFTNGENDPWKDLTLASTQALEFLKRQKIDRAKKHSDDIATALKYPHHSETARHPPLPTVSSTSPASSVATAAGPTTTTTWKLMPAKKSGLSVKPTASPGTPHSALRDKPLDSAPYFRQGHPRYQHRCPRLRRSSRAPHCNRGKERTPHYRVIVPGVEQDDEDDKVLNTESAKAPRRRDSKANSGGQDDQDDVYDHDDNDEGNRNVMRIIPGASHCQDILYDSNDLESVELREEREHVLKTFVRWIEMDVKRQQHQQQKQR
ncbi:hypothetical protein BGZ58_008929 [Dissophora ornata]|nr:hypothetical protein BGZ58_008929 [Dissophora ornata]